MPPLASSSPAPTRQVPWGRRCSADATRCNDGASGNPRLLILLSSAAEQPTDQTLYFFRVFPGAVDVAYTERPMKIEIVVDPSKPAPAASLAARVAPAPVAAAVAEATPRFVPFRLVSLIN